MSAIARLCLSLVVLVAAQQAAAGNYYRCDDGSGTAIYQTLPCGAASRTVAQRVYADALPPEPSARAKSDKPAKPAKLPARSAAGRNATPTAPVRGREREAIAAYACILPTEQWIQAQPCAGTASTVPRARGAASTAKPGPKPRQRGLTQSEVCRHVRDGSYRGARGERAADSTYKRNLMRDRGRC